MERQAMSSIIANKLQVAEAAAHAGSDSAPAAGCLGGSKGSASPLAGGGPLAASFLLLQRKGPSPASMSMSIQVLSCLWASQRNG